MEAVIFANGEVCPSDLKRDFKDAELLIAADGGYRHFQSLEVLPDLLIGDLDSTPEEVQVSWEKRGVTIIRHPEDKDQTDLELALLYADKRGAAQILVYGAVGGRLDMTLSNLLLLAHPEISADLTFLCGDQEVKLIPRGQSLTIQGKPGDRVSLIPLGPGTSGISTVNLKYPLDQDELAFGLTRGISNVMDADHAEISLEEGLLALIHTHSDSKEKQ
jgi:thiamine pyrophosphokinase